MKQLNISIENNLYEEIKIEAVKADLPLNKYVSNLLMERKK